MTLMSGFCAFSRSVATVEISTASTVNPFSAWKRMSLPLPQAMSRALPTEARDQYFVRIGEAQILPGASDGGRPIFSVNFLP
jgi:hypothetical protein